MNLEIIVSSLYLMTLPSERGPTKMQREIISFLEVSPKALIPLFHCHWMWHWEVLSCPAFSFIAQPGCLSYIDCDARLSSPPSLLLCYFTHRQPGTRRLFPCLCICPTQQARPSCCPAGQVQRLYKPHIRQASEENKENFCICGFLSFRLHL